MFSTTMRECVASARAQICKPEFPDVLAVYVMMTPHTVGRGTWPHRLASLGRGSSRQPYHPANIPHTCVREF
jgi:hypothetical protein